VSRAVVRARRQAASDPSPTVLANASPVLAHAAKAAVHGANLVSAILRACPLLLHAPASGAKAVPLDAHAIPIAIFDAGGFVPARATFLLASVTVPELFTDAQLLRAVPLPVGLVAEVLVLKVFSLLLLRLLHHLLPRTQCTRRSSTCIKVTSRLLAAAAAGTASFLVVVRAVVARALPAKADPGSAVAGRPRWAVAALCGGLVAHAPRPARIAIACSVRARAVAGAAGVGALHGNLALRAHPARHANARFRDRTIPMAAAAGLDGTIDASPTGEAEALAVGAIATAIAEIRAEVLASDSIVANEALAHAVLAPTVAPAILGAHRRRCPFHGCHCCAEVRSFDLLWRKSRHCTDHGRERSLTANAPVTSKASASSVVAITMAAAILHATVELAPFSIESLTAHTSPHEAGAMTGAIVFARRYITRVASVALCALANPVLAQSMAAAGTLSLLVRKRDWVANLIGRRCRGTITGMRIALMDGAFAGRICEGQ